jgi:Cu2+-containing amine oxidase
MLSCLYFVHRQHNSLFAGDYGLGFCANSLELGCDCVGTIHYFDGLLNNAKGGPPTAMSGAVMNFGFDIGRCKMSSLLCLLDYH